MERHIAKRLGIGCAMISAPMHVQDFPARYSPQMGFEGANVIFDSWVHPLVMGLEEHLLGMFREDFEFHDGATASHLASEGGHAVSRPAAVADGAAATAADTVSAPASVAVAEAATPATQADTAAAAQDMTWDDEAQQELRKIPCFVRGKARRNTEAYAREQGLAEVTLDTLYEAKAHYGNR